MIWNNLELPEQNVYLKDDDTVIYCADCRDILPLLPKVDLVLTDPPYPDYHTEIYQYKDGLIDMLDIIDCRQLVFWSAKVDFPLNYTAVHIWDKIGWNTVSDYERIFERNGNKVYRLYRYSSPRTPLICQMIKDVFGLHPSQKPQKLISNLVMKYSKRDNLILDPFLGSGTTAYCAKKLGRKCIGIEISEKYCQIAVERLRQSVMKLE